MVPNKVKSPSLFLHMCPPLSYLKLLIVLDETVYMLEDLCKHLQDVIDNKDKLIRQLREAHDDHMTVDADLHRYVNIATF